MKTPLPVRPRPEYIFRIVKRDERATYARIMRRTYAVHLRDLNRALIGFQREVGKALMPVLQPVIDVLMKLSR